MPQTAIKTQISALKQHRDRLAKISMREQFANDAGRAERYTAQCDGLILDYSKNRIDDECLNELLELVQSAGVIQARDAMFAGKKINFTENRAVQHTALRADSSTPVFADGKDITTEIKQSKICLSSFASQIRNGSYQVSGGAVTDVVNIGIGGSDLGPVMCASALSPYHDGPNIHFVSNVDGADFHDTTENLDPTTTLFIIASKSFTTQETMANAELARQWLSAAIQDQDIGKHFVALSTNLEATRNFGIPEERTFGFWDWVGGRYSIWSAIGLSLMIAIGPKEFNNFTLGGRSADQHFRQEKFENNIPVLMALVGIWHRNVWNFPSHAILPYDNRLSRFPAYLQQLDMESNGKHICSDGSDSEFETGPIIWGEPGTNGQHAFYQLLHQGTDIVPCDFLVAANSHEEDQAHQKFLVANCLAQSQAMMRGRSLNEAMQNLQDTGRTKKEIEKLAPHKTFVGNRPSNTIMYPKLTPFVLGQLIAFYEHKVFVQGVIWGINSFDQWGVELGKQLATQIIPLLDEKSLASVPDILDGSTRSLIEKFHQLQK